MVAALTDITPSRRLHNGGERGAASLKRIVTLAAFAEIACAGFGVSSPDARKDF